MILTAANLMAKAVIWSVATGFANSGAKSEEAAENLTQRELRAKTKAEKAGKFRRR
ncbi:hypothetical protein TIFTF001_018578 [Ficus carica]|uniref:Uncharacterized protein n=1 Tax=Ficus carica TaxID=3494 RepID=A0AA88DJ89_FICCA|nr:hypothetical protein TIFTF001_018578 [Ficus carica]